MKRCRLPLALTVGTLLSMVLLGCGSAQRDSDASPLAALSSSISGAAARVEEKASSTEKPNFLSTRGSKIVDSEGREVRITGVNWFGMETGTFAPHGLWVRNWEDMLDQIASLGFNTIRLPFSNQLLDPSSRTGEGVDFELNPDLKGLSGVEVLDKIVVGAGKRGLKVILDRHRPDIKAQAKLWYTDSYPEERWIADWVMLAKRYKGNDTVIGADLHNEPAGDATWGSGDPKTDWRLAAERAGNAILDANPDWLIIVEGIEKTDNDKKWYWMGGNLLDAGRYPVRLKVPNKLVYSAHDYGPEVYMQGWFKDSSFPANLPAVWDSYWGYLAKQGTAPVLMGEFGGRSVGQDLAGTWQRTLVHYLKERGISYTYWAINPNSGDTGGILQDDWKTVNQDKMSLLSTYREPKIRVVKPSQVDTSAAPVLAGAQASTSPIPEGRAAPEPGLGDPSVQLLYQAGRAESQTNSPSMRLKIVNSGVVPIRLGDLEVRYWFNPDDETGSKTQYLDVDWASIGSDRIEGSFVKETPQLDYLSLTFRERDRFLEPGASVEIVARIHRQDWSQYDQTNDYSFSPVSEQRQWRRVTAYVGGRLIWGVEPKLD